MELKSGKRVWFLISNLIEIKNIRSGIVEGVSNDTVFVVDRGTKWSIPATEKFFDSEREILEYIKKDKKKWRSGKWY